jgi:hypothetical protein
MSRNMWIIVGLVVAGVGAAVAIGFASRSQSVPEEEFCNSLASFQSSVNNLAAFDPSTAAQGQLQSDVSAVQSAWSNVRSSAQNLHNANTSSIQSAWNEFVQSVKSIPSSASASTAAGDVTNSVTALKSAINASIDSYSCTSSGSTTTTTTAST